MESIWHVSLISFKSDVSDETRQDSFECLQTLGENCGGKKAGIMYWEVGRNLDLRKNIHLVVISIFESEDAFQAFKQHSEHKGIGESLKQIADWWVGDVRHDLPGI